jgi:hypothetical protein
MKLYSYSCKLLTFVEARWIKSKFAAFGILIGIIIPFSIVKMNQSNGYSLESRSANTLSAENNFLRQQVNQISLSVSKMEMQATQLNERSNDLHLLLQNDKIIGDTVSRFTIAANEFKHQPLILATKSFPLDCNPGLHASNSKFMEKRTR